MQQARSVRPQACVAGRGQRTLLACRVWQQSDWMRARCGLSVHGVRHDARAFDWESSRKRAAHAACRTALGEAVAALSESVTSEVCDVFLGVSAAQLEAVVSALYDARARGARVVCYGVGREGLVMKGLAMRLYHLGVQGGVAGEMTCPPLRAGDVALLSAGPGSFSTVAALAQQARKAGATVLAVTAQDKLLEFADFTLTIPAATMPVHGEAAAGAARASTLPMGSSYEAASWLLWDIVCLVLQREFGISDEEMSRRHTNME